MVLAHPVRAAYGPATALPDAVGWVALAEGGRMLQMRLGPGMTIHAPTGAMPWQFREVVLLGRDTRVADVQQPDWTRQVARK